MVGDDERGDVDEGVILTILDLTAAAVAAERVILRLADREITSSADPGCGAPGEDRRITVPVVSPSAEEGHLVVDLAPDSPEPDVVAERLAATVAIIEDHLDRRLEHDQLDELGAVLRDTRDQLALSNRDLEQFAYIAAHELASPLRAVSAFSDILGSIVATDDARVAQCAEQIRSGVVRMHEQVHQLLQLSRVHGDTTEPEPVDLAAVVHAAFDPIAPAYDEVGATLVVDPLPTVWGRAVPLQSVFANLLTNALRYRDRDRPLVVTVRTGPANGSGSPGVRIEVIDNGSGVADADRARIFGLFERASTKAQGSGIGLSLSRRIVEAHGGEIGVDPAPVGSIFWIRLPVDDATPSGAVRLEASGDDRLGQ